jgi:RNA polymerase sigma factor FliA
MHTEPTSHQKQIVPTNIASLPGHNPVHAANSENAGVRALTQTVRDRLVMEHLPAVRFIARRIHDRLPGHMELDDLISAGLVGLIDAASKFDGTKQVQFRSYAQFRIRGAILDSLRGLDWSPRELRRKGRARAEVTRNLSMKLGRVPADLEVAEAMNMDLQTYYRFSGELDRVTLESLHVEHTDDAGDEELDFLPAPETENPLKVFMDGERKEQLSAALASLPEKERLVLTLYYYEELTLKEIGFTLGVVESRVCQIRTSALRRLRAVLAHKPSESGRGRPDSAWN